MDYDGFSKNEWSSTAEFITRTIVENEMAGFLNPTQTVVAVENPCFLPGWLWKRLAFF